MFSHQLFIVLIPAPRQLEIPQERPLLGLFIFVRLFVCSRFFPLDPFRFIHACYYPEAESVPSLTFLNLNVPTE